MSSAHLPLCWSFVFPLFLLGVALIAICIQTLTLNRESRLLRRWISAGIQPPVSIPRPSPLMTEAPGASPGLTTRRCHRIPRRTVRPCRVSRLRARCRRRHRTLPSRKSLHSVRTFRKRHMQTETSMSESLKIAIPRLSLSLDDFLDF